MALDPARRKQLQQALLSAFPRAGDLAQLVRFGLDASLEAVVTAGPLTQMVFDLIDWAEAEGRLDDLLAEAGKERPNNPALKAYLAEATPGPGGLPGAPHPAGGGVVFNGPVNLTGPVLGSVGTLNMGDIIGGGLTRHVETVQGDKIIVGDIHDSTGVAIGRDASATVTEATARQEPAGPLAPALRQIAASGAPASEKDFATTLTTRIEAEVMRGDAADGARIAAWLGALGADAPAIRAAVIACLLDPATAVAPTVRAMVTQAAGAG
jgi:Effector-associated domain 1